MAPGRRRGANRAKAKGLRLGDLVLAKVKGFPAWPAKISRPEDWDHSPDPKKYFVQFFGTSEIAFVAPADIQIFTNESKSKLSARCQGKTVKYFALAVEEICDAFEKLQQKGSGEPAEDTDETAVGLVSSSTDGLESTKHPEHEMAQVEIQDKILEPEKSDKNVCSIDELHELGRCSRSRKGVVNNMNASTCGTKSPVTSVNKRNKASIASVQTPEEAKNLLLKSASGTSSLKEEIFTSHIGVSEENVSEMCTKTKISKTPPKGSAGGGSQQLHDPGYNEHYCSPPLAASLHSKSAGSEQKVVENGHGMAVVICELKRKVDKALKVQKRSASQKQLKNASSDGCVEPPECSKEFGCEDKISDPCDSSRESSKNTSILETHTSNRKGSKSLKKSKEHSSGKDILHEGLHNEKTYITRGHTIEGSSEEISQFRNKKHKMVGAEDSGLAKRSKCADEGGNMTKGSRNGDSSHLVTKHNGDKVVRSSKSMCVKTDNYLASRTKLHDNKSQLPSDDAVLYQTKLRHRKSEAMPNSATESAADTTKKIDFEKNNKLSSVHDTSTSTHVHSGRRSVRFDDEDEEEQHKSPIHKETAGILMTAHSDAPDSVEKSNLQPESLINSPPNVNDVMIERQSSISTRGERPSIDKKLPVKVRNGSSEDSPTEVEERSPEDATRVLSSNSPGKSENQKSSYKVGRPVILSPKTSVGFGDAAKVAKQKKIKPQVKASVTSIKKVHANSSKLSSKASESTNQSHNELVTRKSISSSSEKFKVTPKSSIQMTVVTENRSDVNFSAERNMEKDVLIEERSKVAREDKAASSSIDNKLTDSFRSMKHLIAQAKRRQAHTQDLPNDSVIPGSVSTPPVIHRSPCPVSSANYSQSENLVQKDTKWVHVAASFGSPSVFSRQLSSMKQAEPGEHDHRISPGYQQQSSSLSGGTEAAIARDALEGMIETLSRTRDSIGRATRLAIDCAKYGIASEVVELLIRKLESESSFHRRVDLFFLVDSITQCSYSQKGIAGASYIPIVQAALPRLLGAAAPPGTGARENRRQCLKVLRLWLERKILPESLLRHYMDDIEVPNDDMNAGFFLRRPSRAERSVDDPIREMEGMLVDEYGSNATFQLPGLLSSHVFDDEEDLPSSLCKDTANESPVEVGSALEEPDACGVSPSDRRHHILEHVDGELDMEDESAISKDGKGIAKNASLILEAHHKTSDRTLELMLDNQTDLPPLPMGSPPLPLDPPPSPPPLPPSSPPPPPPPPLSPPPPPPPPPLSLPPLPSLPTPLPSPPPSYVYHPSIPQEYCRTASGNKLVQITGNGTIQGDGNAVVKSEVVLQQSPNFVTTGICNAQSVPGFTSSRQFEYGHNDMYLTPQASHTNHQFQPGNASIQQRPYQPIPPTQTPQSHPLTNAQIPSNHLSYVKPMIPQQVQQPYNSYAMPSHPNGQRQYATNEQWGVHSSDINPDNQHGSWVSGWRTPSRSGVPFVQDGFFKSNMERSSSSSMGIQLPLHNSMPSVASFPVPPGHSLPHMLPSRPNVPALNCWRPT